MKKFIFSKYFLLNSCITIITPVIFSATLVVLYSSTEFLLFFIGLIPWIFFSFIVLSDLYLYISWSELIFYLIPYILYFTLFTFLHFYFYRNSKNNMWYIATIILTFTNIYFGYTTLIMMMQ